MAEMNVAEKGGQKKTKPKKMSTRVDFTPMVDLGFLLITFFMLTTTLIKPQTMEISMPSRDKVKEEEQTKVKASKAITIILAKDNQVMYYFGTRENNVDPQIVTTTYSPDGIRKVLLDRNLVVVNKIIDLKNQKSSKKISDEEFKKKVTEARADKEAPVVLIKASEESSYKNLVDILDEMQICNIGRFAIVDISDYDKSLMNPANKK